MAISGVENLIRGRKYPFFIALSLFLLTLTFFLLSSSSSFPSPFFSSSFSSSSSSSSSTTTTVTTTPTPTTTTAPTAPSNTTTTTTTTTTTNTNTSVAGDVNNFVNNAASVEEKEAIQWKLCKGPAAVDYIPCLDNFQAIKKLKSRRHMEHRERHCPNPAPTCLVPLPVGYKVPVLWPKSRDMVRVSPFLG